MIIKAEFHGPFWRAQLYGSRDLTHLVLKPEYFGQSVSYTSFPYCFDYLLHFKVSKWQEMWIYLYIF